jgi:hypothetical protein
VKRRIQQTVERISAKRRGFSIIVAGLAIILEILFV